MNELIRKCLQYKISIIETDEFDQGLKKTIKLWSHIWSCPRNII